MPDNDKICNIRKKGTISLEDGVLVCRHEDGSLYGNIIMGAAGLYFDGMEPIACQKDDPPKWRGASRNPSGTVGGVILSGSRLREDDQMEENGYLRIGSMDHPDKDNGMYKVMLRGEGIEGASPADGMLTASVITSEYSVEEFGVKKLWSGMVNWMGWLWKYANPGDQPPSQGNDPNDPHATAWALRSPAGKFVTYQQDEGNLVTYNEQTGKAVWSTPVPSSEESALTSADLSKEESQAQKTIPEKKGKKK